MKIRRSTCLSIAAHLAFGNLLGLEKECDGEENRESFGRASSDEGFVFRATADFVEASVVLMAYDCHRKGEDEMRERKKRARGAKSQGNERHGGGGVVYTSRSQRRFSNVFTGEHLRRRRRMEVMRREGCTSSVARALKIHETDIHLDSRTPLSSPSGLRPRSLKLRFGWTEEVS